MQRSTPSSATFTAPLLRVCGRWLKVPFQSTGVNDRQQKSAWSSSRVSVAVEMEIFKRRRERCQQRMRKGHDCPMALRMNVWFSLRTQPLRTFCFRGKRWRKWLFFQRVRFLIVISESSLQRSQKTRSLRHSSSQQMSKAQLETKRAPQTHQVQKFRNQKVKTVNLAENVDRKSFRHNIEGVVVGNTRREHFNRRHIAQ